MGGCRLSRGACRICCNGALRFDDALGVHEQHLYTNYARSKLAITHLGMQQAARWKDLGISVNVVNPSSLMPSGMVSKAVANGDANVGAENVLRVAVGEAFSKVIGAYADGDDGMKIREVLQRRDKATLARLEESVRQTIGLPSLAALGGSPKGLSSMSDFDRANASCA